jgi:endoglucanase Acf2
MAIRWRKNGDMVCAAMSDSEEGDTYIDDRLHYQLSVISRAIIADVDHEKNGLWYWVHDENNRLRGKREFEII